MPTFLTQIHSSTRSAHIYPTNRSDAELEQAPGQPTIMPAIREPSTPVKSETRSSPYPTPSPSGGSKGWTQEQKSMLFDHVRQNGETAWEKACPGKTSQQSREQWKKTLLPMIKKQCGL